MLAEDPATGRVEAEPVQAVIADPASPLMTVDMAGITVTVAAWWAAPSMHKASRR